ncbi:MAG: BMC domain-containing protein, partial [Chloroflexi bacterium]
MAGGRVPDRQDALGIVETSTAAAAIQAADAGLKSAHVRLVEIRLADGL